MKTEKKKFTKLGILVKKRLIDINMTQTELAALLGTNKQYLNKIFTGERSGNKYIDKIIEILKINT